MIKGFIVTVLFVTGCLCRTVPDDIPVSDNPEVQTSISSDASKSENTQELSTEVSVGDKELIANSESPEQSVESKSANAENSESKDVQVRSIEDVATGNSENNEESVDKTNLDDVTAISSENSEVSTTADASDSKGDEVTRTSRNSESNSSAELKSASVETETGDDASHIHVKEQSKQAPSEEDVPSETNASEENSTALSVENKPKAESVEEEAQVRSASPEVETSSDANEYNTKSAETRGDAVGLIGHAADALIGLPLNRRMMTDRHRDKAERHAFEPADTELSPQGETTTSGHQVHSNYLGASRSVHSQYPYTPLEDPTSPKLPSAKESSAVPVIPSNKLRSGSPDIPSQNPNQNEHFKPRVLPILPQSNEKLKPLLSHQPQHPNNAYGPLPQPPPPQTYGPYMPPPLQLPIQSFNPLPLPTPERFLPITQQLEQVPLFKPDCVRSRCNNPPIQHWQPQLTFPKLVSPWPARNALRTMQSFNPLNNDPNMFSMFKHAAPELVPLSDTFSGSLNSFQSAPSMISSSAAAHASAFTSF